MIETAKPDERIRLNVGGRVFETWRSTILTYPETVLAKAIGPLGKPDKDGVFFIDRDPDCFAAVLNYYRTKVLVCPPTVSPELFAAELDHWQLEATQVGGKSFFNMDRWWVEKAVNKLPENHALKRITAIIDRHVSPATRKFFISFTNPCRGTISATVFPFEVTDYPKLPVEEHIRCYIRVLVTFFNFSRVESQKKEVDAKDQIVIDGKVELAPYDQIFEQDGKRFIWGILFTF